MINRTLLRQYFFSIFGVKRHCTVLHDGRIGIQNDAAGTGKFFGLLKFLHSLDL